jgi:glycosyltransferase involved in cell wall biosynthesis
MKIICSLRLNQWACASPSPRGHFLPAKTFYPVPVLEYPSLGSERQAASGPIGRSFSCFVALVKTDKRKILALIGRRDLVSDGVWDYCTLLSEALRPHGMDMELSEVNWAQSGWLAALRKLRSQLFTSPGEWALLQYTAMAWSRRGFPLGALAIAWAAKNRGVRLAVVLHEPRGFQASGIWARFRFACQQWVIRRLYSLADVCIFTVPPATVPWLRRDDSKICFIPIGSNIQENMTLRQRATSADSPKTVAVFCVTNLARTAWEVAEIAAAIRHAGKSVPHLRLIVFGRGAMEARNLLENALAGSGAECSILGVLPAEEVARILSEADALLYVRDALTPQHGSALAAVASGLPLVAYGDEATSFPLSEAGIILVPPGDREALGCALRRVLTDDPLWNSLHLRSLSAYKKYFAWEEIARRYATALEISVSAQTVSHSQETHELNVLGSASYQVGTHPGQEDLRPREASDAS